VVILFAFCSLVVLVLFVLQNPLQLMALMAPMALIAPL